MSNKLESYISFLSSKHQALIDDVRAGANEPFTVLSIIHWIGHSSDLSEKLSTLIVKECQDILDKFQPNSEGISSMASLTMRPDRCRPACFGTWADYERIQVKLPSLELLVGKKMAILAKPYEENMLAQQRTMMWDA
jgi:hypothetical protein